MAETLTIARLGHRGDGIADTPHGPVYVPLTLEGDVVRARVSGQRAQLETIETASPDRITPACGHFGDCGGCGLQHLSLERESRFKHDLVVEAFRQAGIDTPVEDPWRAPPASRRRAVFAARWTPEGVLFGFSARKEHRIVAIEACTVLTPALVAALPRLRRFARLIADRKGTTRISVLDTADGLDVSVVQASAQGAKLPEKLVRDALELGFARLSVEGETLIESRTPALAMGASRVVPPPGAFTQASVAAEEAMAALVREGVGKARHTADLFCGLGTFALRLCQTMRVHGVESDGAAMEAMLRAHRATPDLKPLTAERRDLFRRPLRPDELKLFDAVVFDPPRAGAEAQAEQLAKSAVTRIVAVSCNPTTLARDVRLLQAGGYHLTRVVPIDQFLHAAHVEAIAMLERPA